MLVNPKMDLEKCVSSALLVLLTLLVLYPPFEEIGALGSPIGSAKRGETLEEFLWTKCGIDVTHLTEVYKDLDVSVYRTLGSDAPANKISEEDHVRKFLNVLHQRMHPELFHCLRENVFTSHISGDYSFLSRRYMDLLESITSKLPAEMRRYLAVVSEETAEERALSPVPGPAPAPAPAPGPAPIAVPVAAPSPAPIAVLVTAPTPAPFEPKSAPAPSESSVSGPGSAGDGNIVSSDSQAGSNKKSSSKKITIAVVVTAVVTFIFALILFACCRKFYGKQSGNGYKDDRPLLSLSDYSGSPKSNVYYGSPHVVGFQSYGNNASEGKRTGIMQSAAVIAPEDGVGNANVSALPLKLPPGRVPPHGLPSLKPPPGRAQPLPPEPPASSRTSSIRANPPPPPPPPPTPPPIPARPPPPAPPPLPRRPPSGGAGPPPPGPPPPPRPPGTITGPRPPPLKSGASLPHPPSGSGVKADADASRTRLKPFFWDKVLADPDHSMVWHQIKSGSFQFNEEMIESLFGYAPVDKNKAAQQKDSSSRESPSQLVKLINPKKAQNLSILLRALNVTTEEVCDALEQGNELPPDFLETLLKMAPTSDEELKLRLFSGELSQLGPAERFLKVLVDIPFAFKRMDALYFMCTFDEEVANIKESFIALEAACKDLKNSRLFLKLLEAVLKTGNRMNDGTFRGGAQAFKLDTLLKLSDVKGVDGKTTLLHFVVQEIIRSEGIRAARAAKQSRSFNSVKSDDLVEDVDDEPDELLCARGLEVVSSLGEQMESVRKAAGIDGDTLTLSVGKLRTSLVRSRNFLNSEMKNVEVENGFRKVLKCFIDEAEVEIKSLAEEEKRVTEVMKSTADYFHGTAGKEEGLRLFVIVRNFLIMLEKVCVETREKLRKSKGANTKKDPPFR